MTEALKSLAKADYTYDFWRGPGVVRSGEDARQGINCVTLAHMALARMGVWLPRALHANEMFLDMQNTGRYIAPTAGDSQLWRPGDVVFFGVDRPDTVAKRFVPRYSQDGRGDLMNWSASPIRHVGVVADNSDGVPMLLHIDRDGVAVVPPEDIMDSEWHEKVWGVGRPVALPETEA